MKLQPQHITIVLVILRNFIHYFILIISLIHVHIHVIDGVKIILFCRVLSYLMDVHV